MSGNKFLKVILILFVTLSNFTFNIVNINGKEAIENNELVNIETYDSINNMALKSSDNISISFHYTWNDTNSSERPELVSFKIFTEDKPNIAYEKFSIVDDRNNNWTEFSRIVPKYAYGHEEKYFIEIEPISGYETIIEGDYKTGYKIEFIKTSDNVDLDVSHNFIDFNNEYNKRPKTVEVNLMKKIPNGHSNKVETIYLSESNDWKHRFSNLPKYRLDKIIDYYIEVKSINEYKSSIVKGDLNNYEISSTINIKLVDFNVKLNFRDANDITEKRPEYIEYDIYRQFANGQEQFYRKISQKSNEDLNLKLPENEKGHPITYSIREENVAGYEIKVKKASLNNYTIDYKLLGDTTSAFFEVNWQGDESLIDFARPEEILIILEAVNSKGEYVMIDTLNVNASDDWKGKFTNLPRLLNGELIKYRVSTNVNGYKTSLEIDSGLVHIINLEFLNNTYAVMVKTKWNDFDNRDKMRPQSINLKITGTVKDDITVVDESINAEEGTSLLILKKYYKGELINYDFRAADTEYYTNSISGDINDGFSLISTYKDEKSKTSFTINWLDEDNNDGVRPEDLDFSVYRDESGLEVLQDKANVNEANDWKFTFTNLSKYYDNNIAKYSFKHVIPEGYIIESFITDEDENIVTFKREVEKISINVDNEFFDNSNNDGKRPKELLIKLLSKDANNNVVNHDSIVLKDGNTKTTFKDVRRFNVGKEVDYYLELTENDGYTYTVTGDHKTGFKINHYHDDEKISIDTSLIWEDNSNNDGFRPKNVTINLINDQIGKIVETVVISEDLNGDWKYTFKDLLKYDNSNEIKYSISFEEVDAYLAKIDNKYEITYYHEDEVRVLEVETTWENDTELNRPENIEIQLYSDRDLDNPIQVIKIDSNIMFYTFENLKKFKDGKSINYYVRIKTLEDYNSVYGEYDNKVIIKNIYDQNNSGSNSTIDTGASDYRSSFIIVISVSILALLFLRKQSIKRI